MAGARLHKEIYLYQFLENDSSRWARSGRYTTDLKYDLWSASAWAKQALKRGRLTLTPIVRFEYVDMVRRDLLAASRNPGLNPDNAPELDHAYPVFLPGFAVDVKVLRQALGKPRTQNVLHVFSSVYRGFIAPNSQFAFLVEENGAVTTPVPGADLNMKPELSMNAEAGLRGTLADGRISGQVAGFVSRIRNFYAAGQGEVFQSLGEVWIRGAEAGVDLELLGNVDQSGHSLKLALSGTLLQSQITGGELRDRDLAVNAIHSEASAQEMVDKINNQIGVIAYTTDASGQEVAMNAPITTADLDVLTSLGFRFGQGGIQDYRAPYTPPISVHSRLSYTYKGLNIGLEYHYLAAQYAEYANLESETADGSFGKLPAYSTWDAQINYRLNRKKIDWEFFAAGRNLSNEIYRSSRLNRIASGIFPGAFRQVQAGIGLTF
ncbi:MAG: TonB-dependent receptor [Bacteroidetes bacterium]|nr:TonB-dependent receptor [Bacteroidota bacterium]